MLVLNSMIRSLHRYIAAEEIIDTRLLYMCLMRIRSEILSIYNVFLPSSCSWNSLNTTVPVYPGPIARSYLSWLSNYLSCLYRYNSTFVPEYIIRCISRSGYSRFEFLRAEYFVRNLTLEKKKKNKKTKKGRNVGKNLIAIILAKFRYFSDKLLDNVAICWKTVLFFRNTQ